MGYITKDIAVITEPKILSLSAAPNFVQFASKPSVKSFVEINVQVNIAPFWGEGYFNADGSIASDGTGSGGWLHSQRLAVAAYAGQPFTYNGNNAGAAVNLFLNAAGDIIGTFQTVANAYAGNIPAGAAYVLLSNQLNSVSGAAFTVSATNLIPAAVTGIETQTLIRFIEPSGAVHAFHGTTDPLLVTGSVFYVSSDVSDTAENLREAMLANRWINANFEIRIPAVYDVNSAVNGRVLNIKSKGAGTEYNATITAPNNTANVAYTITVINAASLNRDSISGEAVTAEIELDVYTDADIRLGEDDRLTSADKLGNLALTMQKTYAGVPLWFDVNAIFSQYQKFNTPPAGFGWFDTGTAQVFRFIARKKATNSFTFYQSNALFVLSGYSKASEDVDLAPYTYTEMPIKLLTNKPRTPYIKGQREYLNFIFSDYLVGTTPPVDFQLAVLYRAYNTADEYIGGTYGQVRNRADFKTVNTCALDIDALLTLYPKAGIVRVCLVRGTADVSNSLEYLIRPQALHDLCQFTFLNKLGGWDTFNFDSTVRYDPKAETETFNKTLTPDFKKGDSLETVYTSALSDPRTVEGAPVTDEVAEWLKELAASRVVLDNDGNYVIKEEFSLPQDKKNANMQVPVIKYRLSETYTND